MRTWLRWLSCKPSELVLEGLAGEVAWLRAENDELRRRLGLNSSNSSRPPSSDGPYDKPKRKPSGLRGRSGCKPGTQPGEPGVTRRQVEVPDESQRVERMPAPVAVAALPMRRCSGCGSGRCSMRRRRHLRGSSSSFVVARVCRCCGGGQYWAGPGLGGGGGCRGPGIAARGVLAARAHHLPCGRAAQAAQRVGRVHRVSGRCRQAGGGVAGAVSGQGALPAAGRRAAVRCSDPGSLTPSAHVLGDPVAERALVDPHYLKPSRACLPRPAREFLPLGFA
jgi:Family of unknown function (DUF6444)